MAWITKNSASQQHEHRNEPYLPEAERRRLEAEVLPRYPEKRAAIMPVLHAIQEHHGWIPYQAMEEVGDLLDLTPPQVLDTATFYEEFFLRPKGRYTIWVCQSIACELMGHTTLLERLKTKLGIEVGQTTGDGRFTLMHAECLGACGTAPVALIEEELYENLTADNFERIIDGLD